MSRYTVLIAPVTNMAECKHEGPKSFGLTAEALSPVSTSILNISYYLWKIKIVQYMAEQFWHLMKASKKLHYSTDNNSNYAYKIDSVHF
ncbi:hypothetical protein Trydic_g21920 [Trypoxylus dichotomus]